MVLFTLQVMRKEKQCYSSGRRDMKELFQHVGKIVNGDNYKETVQKIKDGLISRTNSVVQRNMLFSNFSQGNEKWSQEISNAAKLISYENYDWQQAAVDAMILRSSNSKLRKRALQDNASYDELMKLGISKEQSVKGAHMLEQVKGAHMLEQASGHSSNDTKVSEEVR